MSFLLSEDIDTHTQKADRSTWPLKWSLVTSRKTNETLIGSILKPGPHQQQCPSNTVEATGNFLATFDFVEATFNFGERTKFQRKTRSTLLSFLATNLAFLFSSHHCCHQKRQQCRSSVIPLSKEYSTL